MYRLFDLSGANLTLEHIFRMLLRTLRFNLYLHVSELAI